MSALSARKVRFQSNYRAPFGSSGLIDVATGQGIEIVRGNATRFEIAFYEGITLADLSDVESLNLKIQPSQTEDGVLADATITALDLEITAETWAAGTAQHAVFEFTNAEMNLDPQGEMRELWAVVTAILTGGGEVTLAAGSIVLHEDNNGSLADPPENPGTYLTLEQGDARYARTDLLLTVLGIPTYANLTAANAALTIGRIYYDETLETLNTATA